MGREAVAKACIFVLWYYHMVCWIKDKGLLYVEVVTMQNVNFRTSFQQKQWILVAFFYILC